MKKIKIYLVCIILLVTLVILSNTVNASACFNLKLNSTKNSYSKGDTVSVNIDLANVTDDSGIAGYQAKLSYDSNVLTLDGVTSNNWEVMQNEGAIVANTKDALGTSSGTTAVATFKVNENTTASSTTIKMSNIKGTSGDLETVEGTSTELKITIKTDDSNNGGTNSNGTINNGTTNNGTTNNGTTNNGTNNNGTINNGTNNNGTINNGTTNNGTNNNGTTNNGTNNNGTTNNGTNNNGTINNGTNNNGTTNSGTTNNGTNNKINNKVNNTTTGQKIPYAGAEDIIGIVALISVIGIASYIRYRKTL